MQRCSQILADRDNRIALSLVLFITVLIASLAILSEGTYGGADDISHYRIARHAFSDRSLFFDLWGKPLFTILAAPFAQFGFNGVRIFNVLVSAATLWFSYLTARKLRISCSWSVIILTAFAPLYLVMSYTGMTEILFAFVVIFSLWLLSTDRNIAAVILLSFLPFVRNEGFVLWLPIIIGLALKGRHKLIPLLVTGFIVFSLLGSIVFKDLLWIVHRFPYRGAADIYGSGSLFHFIRALPLSAGIPLLVLALAGILSLLFTREKREGSRGFIFTWYIILPALFYFSAHSFVWWRGIGSSAGLVRVLAGVLPLLSLAGALGIDFFAGLLSKTRIPPSWLVTPLVAIMAVEGFTHFDHPTGLNSEEQLVKEAAGWIRSSHFWEQKVYYYNPFLIYLLGLDPYDKSLSQERIPDPESPANGILPGELVVWDSHFGPNEGGLPESALSGNSAFRLAASFGAPEGAEPPELRVAVYERVDGNEEEVNMVINKAATSPGLSGSDSISIGFRSFKGIIEENISSQNGLELYRIDNRSEYSPSLTITIAQLPGREESKIRTTASLICEDNFGDDEILLVTSLDRNGKPYIYLKDDFSLHRNGESEYTGSIDLDIPVEAKMSDELSIYLWNRSSNIFYIKDITVVIFNTGR